MIVTVDLQRLFPLRRLPGLVLALMLALPGPALAETAPPAATADTGALRIEGTYLGRGALCPQLRLGDGEVISLERLPPGSALPEPGAALHLTGRFARVSRCMEGRAFLASAITGP